MPRTKTRPTKIATCIVPMADQKKLTAFYCETLGFEPRVDVPVGPGGERWGEVGLGEETTTSALAPPPPGMATSNRETGISLQTDDIDAYHAQLRDAGVDVDAEVMRPGEPVPAMFWLRDPEGDTLLVVQ
jgi:predicted enzyme related to lactoylglutathione lyase